MTCVDFVPNDDDIVRGIVAPSALYSTDNEGFVSVAVTNWSDHGMEFDRGDVLLSAYQVGGMSVITYQNLSIAQQIYTS